ncbi:hypothetical protein KQX54_019639 [Cotesia glomerata]|uniref:Uncharacterized protein n=1 Tax=Cotesia glomerata TaxID=32391 RepID=A0AAV7J0B9_COTGL|nr:hypothetical protein KQX54_019639 [Cotesia glomerata]
MIFYGNYGVFGSGYLEPNLEQCLKTIYKKPDGNYEDFWSGFLELGSEQCFAATKKKPEVTKQLFQFLRPKYPKKSYLALILDCTWFRTMFCSYLKEDRDFWSDFLEPNLERRPKATKKKARSNLVVFPIFRAKLSKKSVITVILDFMSVKYGFFMETMEFLNLAFWNLIKINVLKLLKKIQTAKISKKSEIALILDYKSEKHDFFMETIEFFGLAFWNLIWNTVLKLLKKSQRHRLKDVLTTAYAYAEAPESEKVKPEMRTSDPCRLSNCPYVDMDMQRNLPVAVEGDGGVSQNPENQTDSRSCMTVDTEQTTLFSILSTIAGHNYQVTCSSRMHRLQLHGLEHL